MIAQKVGSAVNLSKPMVRATVAFLIALAIIWARGFSRLTHGYLWAEDATIFLSQIRSMRYVSFVTSYAGYLHLLPRLIAFLQWKTTNIEQAPIFFVYSCLFLTALSSAYIASAVRLRPIASIFFAMAPVISPQNGEVLLTITNLQWVLFPSLLVLLWQSLIIFDDNCYWLKSVSVVCLALTGPFGVIILPAVLVIAFWNRKSLHRPQVTVLIAFVISVLIQAVVLAAHPVQGLDPWRINWVDRGIRELFWSLLPDVFGREYAVALALMLFFAVFASRTWKVSSFICLLGLLIWAMGVDHVNKTNPALTWYGNGSRYLYLPLLFFFWASILSFEAPRINLAKYSAFVVCCVIFLAGLSFFKIQQWPPAEIQKSSDGYHIRVPPGWHVLIPLHE
jgi:hypothetical protein